MDERRLRRVFHFTEADLAANRGGQLSENQKNRLIAEARAEQKSARESATILFVIAAAGLAVGVTIGSIAPTALGRTLVLFFLGILWPSAWAAKGVRIIRAARTFQEPRLRAVSGRAHTKRHPDGSYGLQIGELEFDLDDNPAGAIIEGDVYALYYLEATDEILSVGYPTGQR